MGAKLCSLRQSNTSDNRVSGRKMPFIDLLKLDCFKAEKRKPLEQEVAKVAKITRVKKVTLEEWLLASPAVRSNAKGSISINGSEVHVTKQPNNRVCPWMNTPSPYMEVSEHFSTLARDSFSLERPKKFEETREELGIVPCLSRSQSGKLKKRVSFRLPEVADIFIFYSPEDGVGNYE